MLRRALYVAALTASLAAAASSALPDKPPPPDGPPVKRKGDCVKVFGFCGNMDYFCVVNNGTCAVPPDPLPPSWPPSNWGDANLDGCGCVA